MKSCKRSKAERGSVVQEENKKKYQFDFIGQFQGYGTVYANSEEEAKNLIQQNRYNNIIKTSDMEVKNILNIIEEDKSIWKKNI